MAGMNSGLLLAELAAPMPPRQGARLEVEKPLRPGAISLPNVVQASRFHLPFDSRRDSELVILGGGWEHCGPGYVNARTYLPNFFLELIVGGCGQLHLEGRTYPLAEGVAFSYGPGVACRIAAAPSNPLKKFYVEFSGSAAGTLLDEVNFGPGTCRKTGADLELEHAFDELVDEGKRLPEALSSVCSLRLRIILALLGKVRDASDGRNPIRALGTYRRCRNYLEQNAVSIRTIAGAAQHCHIDPAYLSRLFMRFGRLPPHQWLERCRMRYAAKCLGTGRLVREVADELGIDSFHFSRIFKRVYGRPPSAFRGMNQFKQRDG